MSCYSKITITKMHIHMSPQYSIPILITQWTHVCAIVLDKKCIQVSIWVHRTYTGYNVCHSHKYMNTNSNKSIINKNEKVMDGYFD